MYLLEGMPAPDHATIARFISLHFSACAKVLLAQMSDLLYLLGEISGKTIFIDGAKIESAANKYTLKTAQILMVEDKTVLNQACREGCLGMNCVYKGWGEITTDFAPIWA